MEMVCRGDLLLKMVWARGKHCRAFVRRIQIGKYGQEPLLKRTAAVPSSLDNDGDWRPLDRARLPPIKQAQERLQFVPSEFE